MAAAPPAPQQSSSRRVEHSRNVRARWMLERGRRKAEVATDRENNSSVDTQTELPVETTSRGRVSPAGGMRSATLRAVERDELYSTVERYMWLRERAELLDAAEDDFLVAATTSAANGVGVPLRYRMDTSVGERAWVRAESRRCQRIVLLAFRPLIVSAVSATVHNPVLAGSRSAPYGELTTAAERGVLKALDTLTPEKFSSGRFEGYVPFFVRRQLYEEVAALRKLGKGAGISGAQVAAYNPSGVRVARSEDSGRYAEDKADAMGAQDDDVGGNLGASECDTELEIHLFQSRMGKVLNKRQRAVVCRSLGLGGYQALPGSPERGGGDGGDGVANSERGGTGAAPHSKPEESLSSIARDFGFTRSYISRLHTDGVRRILDDRDSDGGLLSSIDGSDVASSEQLRP